MPREGHQDRFGDGRRPLSIGRYWKKAGERERERERKRESEGRRERETEGGRESENLKVRQFQKSYDFAG